MVVERVAELGTKVLFRLEPVIEDGGQLGPAVGLQDVGQSFPGDGSVGRQQLQHVEGGLELHSQVVGRVWCVETLFRVEFQGCFVNVHAQVLPQQLVPTFTSSHYQVYRLRVEHEDCEATWVCSVGILGQEPVGQHSVESFD